MTENSTPRLLVIVGPTASGKSALALRLANQFSGEIISADSRQIYKDFDIGTGKEVEALREKSAVKQPGKWIIDNIPIHLYDILDGHQNFSAVAYAQKARALIASISLKEKLPLLVGGTGFYINATLHGIQNSGLERSELIRAFLDRKTVPEMQAMLQILSPDTLVSLNNSDKHNPRRLERHIEIAMSKVTTVPKEIISMYPYIESFFATVPAAHNPREAVATIRNPLAADVLLIGLLVPLPELQLRIHKRVENMVALGLVDEVKKLYKSGFTDKDPAFHTMGYSEFVPYFEKKTTLDEVKARIVLHTMQYARRQYTWFKRDKSIQWFDITKEGYVELVVSYAQKWYHNIG